MTHRVQTTAISAITIRLSDKEKAAWLSCLCKGLTKTFISSADRCLPVLRRISSFEPIETCVMLMAHQRNTRSFFDACLLIQSRLEFDRFSHFYGNELTRICPPPFFCNRCNADQGQWLYTQTGIAVIIRTLCRTMGSIYPLTLLSSF